MSEIITPAGRLAPDMPECHKCGMLYGPPERKINTASLFVCFDPDCSGWLLRHDPQHPKDLAALMAGVTIEGIEEVDAADDAETVQFIKQQAGRAG